MKKSFVIGLMILLANSLVLAAETIDLIDWTLTGINTADLFTGNTNDGSITLYSQLNNTRTGLDIGPTRGTLPTSGPLSELVIYKTKDQAIDFERMSFTAHAANPKGFNIDIEKGGAGEALDLNFITNQIEAMRLTPQGNLWLGYTANDTGNNIRGRHILSIDTGNPTSTGTYDSHFLLITGKSHDGLSVHQANWRSGVDVTNNNADSEFVLQSRIDGNGFVNKLVLTDDGGLVITPADTPGGGLYFGSLRDVVLYRQDANILKTDDNLEVGGKFNLGSPVTLTVSNNAVTVTKSFHKIDTSIGAQTVNTINGGRSGDVVTFVRSGSNTLTFADLGTNVQTTGGFILNHAADTITFIYDGSWWLETGRGDNQ